MLHPAGTHYATRATRAGCHWAGADDPGFVRDLRRDAALTLLGVDVGADSSAPDAAGRASAAVGAGHRAARERTSNAPRRWFRPGQPPFGGRTVAARRAACDPRGVGGVRRYRRASSRTWPGWRGPRWRSCAQPL